MNTLTRFLPPILAAALAGCGEQPPPPAEVPLSTAEWKTLPVNQKYTPETLERLKAADPALNTPEGWAAFQKTVAASRRRDFPRGQPRP